MINGGALAGKRLTEEIVRREKVVIPDLKNQFRGNPLLSYIKAPEVCLSKQKEMEICHSDNKCCPNAEP